MLCRADSIAGSGRKMGEVQQLSSKWLATAEFKLPHGLDRTKEEVLYW